MVIYLLKSSLLWGVFLLFYSLLLSRNKAFGKNRGYLWLSMVLGIVIPIFHYSFPINSTKIIAIIPEYFNNVPVSSGSNLSKEVAAASSGFHIEWHMVLLCIWLLGAALQLFLLAISVFNIALLKRKCQQRLFFSLSYFTHKSVSAPFSFGKMIFLPSKNYEPKDLRLILEHEQRHFLYWHWLDNWLLALLQIVFWFHPLVYVFKKQIRLTHELQVDKDVLLQDQFAYCKLLITQNQTRLSGVLIHAFHYSPLKKRIAMMTKSKKSSNWKFALALPLFAGSFLLMSVTNPSKERVTKGNITYFKGNKITWHTHIDTVTVQNPKYQDSSKQVIITSFDKILRCNDIPVTPGFDTETEEFTNPKFETIALNILSALVNSKDSLTKTYGNFIVDNIVLDNNFRVQYYDVLLLADEHMYNDLPALNNQVDKILTDNNLVNPGGLKSDKPYCSMNEVVIKNK